MNLKKNLAFTSFRLQALWCLITSLLPFTPLYTAELFEAHSIPSTWKRVVTTSTLPRRIVTYSFERAGKVTSIPVEIGDLIPEKMQLEIDSTQIDFDIQALKKELEILKEQTKAIEIEKAKQNRRIGHLKKELQRNEKVFQNEGLSEQTIHEQKHQLNLAQDQSQAIALEKKQIQLRIEQQHVQLKKLEDSKARHKLSLPTGWLVLNRLKEPREWANIGEPVLECALVEEQIIEVQISASDWQSLNSGFIKVHYMDFQETRQARVLQIYPIASSSHQQKVTFLVSNPPPLSCGTSVQLSFHKLESEYTIIPDRYLNQAYGQSKVKRSNGSWHTLTPIRRESKGWVVPKSSIPKSAKLLPLKD